jgi:hypothetical protein
MMEIQKPVLNSSLPKLLEEIAAREWLLLAKTETVQLWVALAANLTFQIVIGL